VRAPIGETLLQNSNKIIAMAMNDKSYAYVEFWNSLREDQKKDFWDMSINQQKDWYISYLENHFSITKNK
jgi:tyrosine-protein phosphatase YwqE